MQSIAATPKYLQVSSRSLRVEPRAHGPGLNRPSRHRSAHRPGIYFDRAGCGRDGSGVGHEHTVASAVTRRALVRQRSRQLSGVRHWPCDVSPKRICGMELPVGWDQLWTHVNHPPSSLAATTGSEAPQGDVGTDGTWTIGSGSMAGFRSQLSVLGHLRSIVGHSTALIGSIQVVGGGVAAGSFRIDLASLRIFGNSNARLNRMIDTTRYPAATFMLTKPISLEANPTINVTYRAPATGSLTMHGVTRPVTFMFTARYTGPALEGAGSIAVRFSDWNLKAPFGIQNVGAIEFTLRMSRAPGAFPSPSKSRHRDPQRPSCRKV